MFKRKPYRNKKILKAAEGEECLIQSPYCNGNSETVVACHSNEYDDGKGGSQKADDCFVAFGCSACHDYVDGKPMPKLYLPEFLKLRPHEEKRMQRSYLDRGIKRTIRRLLDLGVIK